MSSFQPLALLILFLVPPMVQAQPAPGGHQKKWLVGLSVGTFTFDGAAKGRSDTGEPLTFVPHRPTMSGLLIGFGGERSRLTLSVRTGQAGLRLRGVPSAEVAEAEAPAPGIVLIFEDAFALGEFTVSASRVLTRLKGGPALRPSLGVTLQRWSAPDMPARSVWGGQAGLGLEMQVIGSWVASFEVEAAYTSDSPFRRQDLPEGFAIRSTWRRSLAVAVGWRF
ncbi:MAG: hypothetical protein HOP28_05565 [Gemmatimonadales bacterium]|nr:hypothetical protein [Gemmatimonadales bacterium]